MQKWEYLCIRAYWELGRVEIDGKYYKNIWCFEFQGKKYLAAERDRIFTELGLNGWELVAVLPFDSTVGSGAGAGTDTTAYHLFFKRPIE